MTLETSCEHNGIDLHPAPRCREAELSEGVFRFAHPGLGSEQLGRVHPGPSQGLTEISDPRSGSRRAAWLHLALQSLLSFKLRSRIRDDGLLDLKLAHDKRPFSGNSRGSF